MPDFNNEVTRKEKAQILKEFAPDLFTILDAFSNGRIVGTQSIQNAFHAEFNDSERFFPSLERVLTDVILAAFDS